MNEFEFKELIFKEFKKSDFNLLELIFTNREVMKYALDDCFNKKQLKNYHKKILKNNSNKKNRNIYEFAVFKNNIYLGFADLTIIKKNNYGGIAEIGYFLLPEYWGKGFATNIAAFLINFCFNHLNLHKVVACCNSDNIGSIKVMKKNGMIQEGYFFKQRFKNNKWVDEYKFAIIR